MMSDYRNQKHAESIIEAISCTPYAEDVFRACLQYSDQTYCVFYVNFMEWCSMSASKLWGILIMQKWDSLELSQQEEYMNFFYQIISFCFVQCAFS